MTSHVSQNEDDFAKGLNKYTYEAIWRNWKKATTKILQQRV
jgi:two-component system CitB family response regulator